MSEENKVIQLDDYRPHSVIEAKCKCGKEWVAVIQTKNEGVLECPGCGEMNNILIDDDGNEFLESLKRESLFTKLVDEDFNDE